MEIRLHFEAYKYCHVWLYKAEIMSAWVIILNCETNDILNEISTLIKLKTFLKEIEGYDTQNKPQVVMSSLTKRYGQNFNKDIKSINEKL